MSPSIDIIIPSFNGKSLLEKHLEDVINNSGDINKIIIIDNGSTDGTFEWLKINYPQIEIIRNKKNLGFTVPVNQGVKLSKADYIVLLNNDVKPQKGYLKNIINHFTDDNLFAVSFNENESSWPAVTWKSGKLNFTRGEDKTNSRYSLWASGGSAIYKRQIWDKLGGFNEVYSPFYWEDIDLGYRAWKSGYKIIWLNSAIVYHEHESTSSQLNKDYVSLIKERNELLFTWLNFSGYKYRISHLLFLIQHIFFHPGYLKVIISALVRIQVNNHKNKFILSDDQVLCLINKKYE